MGIVWGPPSAWHPDVSGSGWRYQEVAPGVLRSSTGRKTSLCRETPGPNGC